MYSFKIRSLVLGILQYNKEMKYINDALCDVMVCKLTENSMWKTYIIDDKQIENAIIHLKNYHDIIITE
jgi:hypothetical protein